MTDDNDQWAHDALAEWSNHIRDRVGYYGKLRGKNCPSVIAAAISTDECHINAATVTHWLNGESAPTAQATHDRLMDFLDLYPLPQKEGVRITPPLMAVANKRTEIETSYMWAKQAMTHLGIAGDIACGDRGKLTGNFAVDHMPPRIYGGNLGCMGLNKRELSETLAHTPNAAEYLEAYVLGLKGKNQTWGDFGQELGLEAHHMNEFFSEGRLPLPSKLREWRSTLFEHNSHAFADYENLVISNRLSIIEAAKEQRLPDVVSSQTSLLPPAYWQAVLEHHHSGHMDQQSRFQGRQAWRNTLPLIEMRGQYMRASRKALSVDFDPIAAAVGVNLNYLIELETDPARVSAGSIARYADVLERLAKEASPEDDGKSLFDRDEFNKCPPRPKPKPFAEKRAAEPEQSWAKKA